MLLVFDLDGTLIDSRRDLADAANALIDERGGRTQSVERISGMVGEGAALLVRRALTAAGLDPDDTGALPRFLELYDERLLVHTRLYEGIRETLDDLSRDHALGVLTNKPEAATRAILEGLNLSHLFQWVLGGDGPRPRKPDPAGLLWIADRAGTPSSGVTMIGDSPIDLATARAAQTRVCIAAYGFGYRADASLRPGELLAHTPAEIPVLVRSRS